MERCDPRLYDAARERVASQEVSMGRSCVCWVCGKALDSNAESHVRLDSAECADWHTLGASCRPVAPEGRQTTLVLDTDEPSVDFVRVRRTLAEDGWWGTILAPCLGVDPRDDARLAAWKTACEEASAFLAQHGT
jgi:hypothetical protein